MGGYKTYADYLEESRKSKIVDHENMMPPTAQPPRTRSANGLDGVSIRTKMLSIDTQIKRARRREVKLGSFIRSGLEKIVSEDKSILSV